MDDVPAMSSIVLGGSAGLMGSVGSSTLLLLSAEKFLMAIINESRSGISPGRFTEPGASPMTVKMAAISSGWSEPEGRPRIHSLESVMLPKGASPSGTLERSSK